jgi:hypothetical protein
MATTPIWVPLVVAFLGLAGILLTQHLANRRQDAQWQRERQREQAVWAREDAARSYEHRRDSYVAFIKEFNRLLDTYNDAAKERGLANARFPRDFLDSLDDHLVQIRIFGTQEAWKLAAEAEQALFFRVCLGKFMPPDSLAPLRSEIRRDLSIPDRPAGGSTA